MYLCARLDRIEEKSAFVLANSKDTFHITRAFESCLACQHIISYWLEKLKPNKLSSGCQNELKGAAVAKAANPGRRGFYFSRGLAAQ